ncbi:MAG: hypothetical protein ACTHMV_15070 [Chitinophagaceae bacterium]
MRSIAASASLPELPQADELKNLPSSVNGLKNKINQLDELLPKIPGMQKPVQKFDSVVSW